MKRSVTINGREKGSLGHCRSIRLVVDATNDKEAFSKLYETHEHIVHARIDDGETSRKMDREGVEPWQ